MTAAVSLRSLSKRYRIYPRQRHRLLEAATFGRIQRGHDFWALKDVDLDVEPGTTLGILGRNGAGKSTLLKIVSGVLQPTSGTARVNGRLAALLQLGAGFNPEFTGRENVLLYGLMLGLERKEIFQRFDEIEEFADLGEFMEQPVKTYSSGMHARLGFAVAVNVEPEVLVVDETLSVGDAVFRHLGLQKMRELRDSGATILFVSHGMGMIKDFCTEAVLLHQGELLFSGETSETIDYYQALIASNEARQKPGAPEYAIEQTNSEPSFKESSELDKRRRGLRHGTGEARIQNVELLNERGESVEWVDQDSRLTVRMHVEYMKDTNGGLLRLTLRNSNGLDVFTTTTSNQGVSLGRRKKGERIIVDFTFEVPLRHGSYSVGAGISHPGRKNLHMDWIDVAAVFEATRSAGSQAVLGLVQLPTEVKVHESAHSGSSGKSA
jgi:ABC-type polysaccharide/polyol phosphate transport system ATPase subunit